MAYKYVLLVSSRLEESAIFIACPVFSLGKAEMRFHSGSVSWTDENISIHKDTYKRKFHIAI